MAQNTSCSAFILFSAELIAQSRESHLHPCLRALLKGCLTSWRDTGGCCSVLDLPETGFEIGCVNLTTLILRFKSEQT